MRPTMIYKGYLAAVEYEDSEELFYGHVVNSGASSIVTFAAADVEGLKREFRISIDDYLASCEEDGVEPTRLAIG
jgi:predicted HicB family RNase H-like nuclease